MISPSTPPGTKIVCINVDNIPLEDTGCVSLPVGLTLGAEYTVDQILPLDLWFDGRRIMCSESVVYLVELLDIVATERGRAGHLTCRFRRRDLPESLVRLQTALRKPAPALG